jgi:hypothetical protein
MNLLDVMILFCMPFISYPEKFGAHFAKIDFSYGKSGVG